MSIMDNSNNQKKLIETLSVKDQVTLVRVYSRNILLLKDPCAEAQLEIVKRKGCDIRFITNPTEEVQRIAVLENMLNIKDIENPCLEVQFLVVRKSSLRVCDINNPAEEVQLAAVQYGDRLTIRCMRNPTDKVQKLVCEKYPLMAQYLKCKSLETIKFVNKLNGVPENFKCTVCHSDEIQEVHKFTNCGHFIHKKCIKTLMPLSIQFKSRCVECKVELSVDDLISDMLQR